MSKNRHHPYVPGEDVLPPDVESLLSKLPRSMPVELPQRNERGYLGDETTVLGEIGDLGGELPLPSDNLRELGAFHGLTLERWVIQAHAYRGETAGKISLLGRLFSGGASKVNCGVVHEAKRYTVLKTDDNRLVQVGVVVRLSAATRAFKAKAEITLPNIAANAQLSSADARVGIDVLGYSGKLGDLLPAPTALDVESLNSYLNAFRAIQERVFGDDDGIVATLLAFDDDEVSEEMEGEG